MNRYRIDAGKNENQRREWESREKKLLKFKHITQPSYAFEGCVFLFWWLCVCACMCCHSFCCQTTFVTTSWRAGVTRNVMGKRGARTIGAYTHTPHYQRAGIFLRALGKKKPSTRQEPPQRPIARAGAFCSVVLCVPRVIAEPRHHRHWPFVIPLILHHSPIRTHLAMRMCRPWVLSVCVCVRRCVCVRVVCTNKITYWIILSIFSIFLIWMTQSNM